MESRGRGARLRKFHSLEIDLLCDVGDEKMDDFCRQRALDLAAEATDGNIDSLLELCGLSRQKGFDVSDELAQESFVAALCGVLEREESIRCNVLLLITNLWFACDDENSLLFTPSLVVSVVECAKLDDWNVAGWAFFALRNFVLSSPRFALHLLENDIVGLVSHKLSLPLTPSCNSVLEFCDALFGELEDKAPCYSLIPGILEYVCGRYPPCRVSSTRCVCTLCSTKDGFGALMEAGVVDVVTNAILWINPTQIPYLLTILTVVVRECGSESVLSETLVEQLLRMLDPEGPSFLGDPSARVDLCDLLAILPSLAENQDLVREIIVQAKEGEGFVRFSACFCLAKFLLDAPSTTLSTLVSNGAVDCITDIVADTDPARMAVMLTALCRVASELPGSIDLSSLSEIQTCDPQCSQCITLLLHGCSPS